MAETKGRIMSDAFSHVFGKLRERYPDPAERGCPFWRLNVDILRTDRAFRRSFGKVWRWRKWPVRDGGDSSADIVAERTRLGGRIESEKSREIVVVNGQRVNHLLHVFLSVFTLGLWLVVWLSLTASAGERREATTRPQESVVDVYPIDPEHFVADAADRPHPPRRRLNSGKT